MSTDVFGLRGKRALVVGGGFGMGRETAILLGQVGADVVVADVDQARAEEVRAEVAATGVTAHAMSGDVTVPAAAVQLVQDAAATLGGLDVLINIVGLAEWSYLMDMDDGMWERQFAINLRHHLDIGRAGARIMIDQGTGGRMAFVSSVSGIYGAPFHAAYGAAKAGLMSLVRTMSQEWGPDGVRVNAVAPDCIATPRVKAGFEAQGADTNELARNTGISLCRFGDPKEIAGPLVYLCSDLAGFTTGQTLIVDGGVHASFPHEMNPFK
jgi:NAD(P)-dependent dehydrogenase (short-subunit alcohol dehydrogenase family)